MYIFLSWIHLTAAIFWVGGMLFLSLVAVPLMKREVDPAQAQRWFINVARRFRSFVWIAIAILVTTGILLLSNHLDFSISLSAWPTVLIVKLVLVVLLIVTSVSHDRIIGPKVRTIKQKASAEWTSTDHVLVRIGPWIGRMTMILGLAVVLAGVMLVRS
ncbi:MAG: membrane protein [Nitrospirales bacterium]|nr:MAG: membrane protein [Nitrospirales bacterium]